MKIIAKSGGLPEDAATAIKLISAFAGDEEMSAAEWKRLHIHNDGSEPTVYQYMIEHLTSCHYSSGEAIRLWRKILRHKFKLLRTLGRNPGMFVAAMDYLNNLSDEQDTLYTPISERQLFNYLEMSLTDGLTGLYNRNAVTLVMEKLLEATKRSGGEVSLLMIDVDDFRNVNNSFGHQVGDEVLKEVAGIIETNIRRMDVAGRYGGDEFMALLPDTSSGEAMVIAERIRLAVFDRFTDTKSVTLSIGIASFPACATTLSECIQVADDALYRVKRSEKNRVLIAEAPHKVGPIASTGTG